jgi:hypothetical protein
MSRMGSSDEELLGFRNEEEPFKYDRRRAERALENYGDAFRHQLVAARHMERWATELRERPGALNPQFVHGYVQALRDVSARIRKCAYLPGGELYEEPRGNTGAFYMPMPDVFGHPDAYRRYTEYAAKLEAAGVSDRFPAVAELRSIALELLADRYAAEDVAETPSLVDDAVAEARRILEARRRERETANDG